ncbi:hypothetical protein AAF712_007136 [Marasmius tenuissimus]|uniref:Uncharacterized protein n=1 Tax=Marasmius tenuissimus TaxID=585030 RepID=A0ABR2ZWV4_9AGAR
MDSPGVSPERPVKITYKSRTKRKRELEDDNDARSVASVEASEVEGSPKRSPSKSKKFTEMGPPDSTKKPEFKVPEGPYKRQRRDSEIPDSVSVGSKKKTHIRSASSVTSFKQLQSSSAASSPTQKPVSRSHKPSSSVSQKNPAPSESEFDDGASIAESISTTNKLRRTEGERIEYFKNQPEASDIEPHHVTCLRCKKTVNLGKRQTYAVKPWETHRTRCDAKVFQSGEDNDNESEAAVTNTTVRPRTTEAERKAILESEAEEVKPDEAKCKRCEKWIRLGNGKYSLGNWQGHQSRCGGVTPSSRVATAERKLRLVNDPGAKSFGPRHVECATCTKSIVLEGEADYTLASWEVHKSECHEPDSSSPKTPSSPERRTIPRPPASVESSSTVVSPEGVEGSPPSRGVKRRLEEDVEEDGAEPLTEPTTEPPTNRPRTETYVPPQKEAPSPLGWFMMPIRSFMRGFRESLS